MIGHTKVSGPLAVLADGFRAELDRLGYTPSSREFKLAEVARLSAWLERRGLGAGDICSARLEEFLADLAARSGRAPTLVAMRPLLAWLRGRGLCGDDPQPAPGPLDELMERYRHWMVTDRQLAPRTIGRYEQGARLFLDGRARRGRGPAGVEGLDEEAVTAFLLAEAAATYLLEARPRAGCRATFLTLVAPPRAMGHTTVGQMVWRQCRIAGLEPVRAHRLRHALATELLSQGVRLPEIAQVLRQRDLATTAIYAKVDYPALRELALPWLVVQ